MDEEETKNCPNCKREIPAVNFTIHSVHCARNIKVCPVCKEPVPSAELDVHYQKYHKLLPCKQCGESVCGTDLEDHIRDSCANTIKTCRFCELELPRRELPAHEGYCGVRTEQCPECREWVMIKYRQLHVDSNHGFIRLDEDPAPAKKEPPKLTIRPARAAPPTSIFGIAADSDNPRPNIGANSRSKMTNHSENLGCRASSSAMPPPPRPSSLPGAGPSYHNDFRPHGSGSSSTASSSTASPQESGSRSVNGVKKRTNDQPQINTNKEVANKVDKDLPTSRGAVKKRPAPKPPRAAPADPRRDMAFYSALQRQQREERERNEQNQYNFAHGLPPVLTAAAKIEKLRKMDALQNPDTADEYRDRMRKRKEDELRQKEDEQRRQEFKNLKPMSPEQFMARFNELQLRGEGDRFGEIKSSLRELRRGLNEVTAPYNNNYNAANNNNSEGALSPSSSDELQLPCEFCNMLVPADDLVQHQTGCRPDLAQYRGPPAAAPPQAALPRAPAAPTDPVIPCEFCAQSLPVYLINEHQERCAREVDILSAD